MAPLENKIDSFPEPLAEGLWVLGNYYFNLYLVVGEQASALIEVGVSGVADEVIRQLESLGVKPTFLVVTHPHADHVTGLTALKERFPSALVVAGEGAPEFLAHPRTMDALVKEDRHMSEVLAAQGLVPGRPPIDEAPSLANSLVARKGDEMDLGGKTLRFLSAKGHSPGGIAVFIPEIKALLPSDSLGFRFPGRGNFPIFFTGYSEYMDTLEELERLQPAIVGVPHQGPVIGAAVAEAFRDAREKAEELRSRIIGDARDPEELARDIFQEFYRDELTLYSKENIMGCVRLIIRRATESKGT